MGAVLGKLICPQVDIKFVHKYKVVSGWSFT